MYYFTFAELGVPKSNEEKFSECNIKAQKTGFSFFFPPGELASCEKAVGFWHYSFITIVADMLRPLSESKGAWVECKFSL